MGFKRNLAQKPLKNDIRSVLKMVDICSIIIKINALNSIYEGRFLRKNQYYFKTK